MATGNLGCVVVAVDGSEESMNGLRWAIDNLRLRPAGEGADGAAEEAGALVVLHVQSPPSIAAGLNPGSVPFGGPGLLPKPDSSSSSSIPNLPLVSSDSCSLIGVSIFRLHRGASLHGGNRGAPEADHGGDHDARPPDLRWERCEIALFLLSRMILFAAQGSFLEDCRQFDWKMLLQI